MNTFLRPAFMLLAFFTFVTGLAYPLLVTAAAKTFFSDKANGSLVYREGKILGSTLIGQEFSGPRYFWGRPSATGNFAYNAMASGGSNLGALHPALVQASQARVQALRAADPTMADAVPADLATASASGLDPEISLAAALYQAPRISRVRGVSEDQIEALIRKTRTGRFLGFSGLERVNVLQMNLALDEIR